MNLVLKYFQFLINLKDEKKIRKLILYLVFIDFLNSFIPISLLAIIYGPDFYNQAFFNFKDIFQNVLHYFQNGVIAVIIFVPFIEEVIFRLPIKTFINKQISLNKKVMYVLSLNIFFFLIHAVGFSLTDLVTAGPTIFISGIIYSSIFIIAGGNRNKNFQALIIVYLAHLLADILIGSVTDVSSLYL